MPARDIYHDTVKSALQKDGWTITHDPFPLQIGKKRLPADLGVFDDEHEAIVQWIPD